MKMQTDAASYWRSRLLKWKRKFLGIDESHRQGWEPVAAMMAMFDCIMLTGDSFQEQPIHSTQDIYRDPMRTNSVTKWMKNNNGIQTYELTASRRVGDTLLSVLKSMNGTKYERLSSKKQKDTLVLPIIFSLHDKENTTLRQGAPSERNPILRSETFFTHLLYWLAYTVMLCAHQDTGKDNCEPKKIGIVGCLNLQLEEFKAYAAHALKTTIHQMQARTRWKSPRYADKWFNFETLLSEGLLTISTPEGCGGLEFYISFNLWLQRDISDNGYRGHLAEPHNIYVMLTRGSQMTFIFIDDLRHTIYAPEGGKHRAEMVHLGAQNVQPVEAGKRRKINASDDNKQLQFLRLLDKCNELLYDGLKVPQYIVDTVNTNIWDPNSRNPRVAIAHSVTLHKLIGEIDPHALAVLVYLSALDVHKEIMDGLVRDYKQMKRRWPASVKPKVDKKTDIRTFLNQQAELQHILQHNKTCQLEPARRDTELPDLQKKYTHRTRHPTETDMETELFPIDPEDVLKQWLPKIIPALTLHISGKTEYIVMLPCVNTISYMPAPAAQQDAGTTTDANHLAKLLTDRTHEILTCDETNTTWTTDTERHKKDEFTVNGYKFIISDRESDRPAFVIRNDNGKKAHHCYWAMGLIDQHAAQLMLLARIYDADVLAAYLEAVTTTLRIKLYNHNLSVFREPLDAHVATRDFVEGKLTGRGILMQEVTDASHQTAMRGPANEIPFENIPEQINIWHNWSGELKDLMSTAMGIEETHVNEISDAWSAMKEQTGL